MPDRNITPSQNPDKLDYTFPLRRCTVRQSRMDRKTLTNISTIDDDASFLPSLPSQTNITFWFKKKTVELRWSSKALNI